MGNLEIRQDALLQAYPRFEEAKEFYNIEPDKTACQAIGYKELAPYFNGEKTLDECLESLKIETRHYAKRQLTWFRKNENINWVYPDDYENQEDMLESVFEKIDKFLKENKQ